jgi:hypothetical protein
MNCTILYVRKRMHAIPSRGKRRKLSKRRKIWKGKGIRQLKIWRRSKLLERILIRRLSCMKRRRGLIRRI